MSEFYCHVVEIGKIEKHPNADRLEIVTVYDNYPVVVQKGMFAEKQLALYCSVDCLLPLKDDRWSFLRDVKKSAKEWHHVKAKKIREVFSMGLLAPIEFDCKLGENLQEKLNIKKFEEPASTDGECVKDPGCMPVYTDIEGIRKYGNVLIPGEQVVIMEKVDGSNARYIYHNHELFCGSHYQIKKRDMNNVFWKVAEKYDVECKLKLFPDKVFYGECFGWIQKLRYGATPGELFLAFYDIFDIVKGKYLDYCECRQIFASVNLPHVPLIYSGSWSEDLVSLASGKTLIEGANHIREGIVVKPNTERFDKRIGRVILKIHSPEYLLSK